MLGLELEWSQLDGFLGHGVQLLCSKGLVK